MTPLLFYLSLLLHRDLSNVAAALLVELETLLHLYQAEAQA